MLIAVSSFGEGLRRVTPLTAPAEALFKELKRCRLGSVSTLIPFLTPYTGSAGSTTMNVAPFPSSDSTQIRPSC
jgi:hypothetical protein